MPGEVERGRNHCIHEDIYVDVVKARAEEEGCVVRKLRVFKDVEEIDFCRAELVKARVEVGRDAWEVSALFKIAVGYDPKHHERVVRTIAYFKTRIPFPLGERPHVIDFSDLEAKVRIDDLHCHATVTTDERVIVAELRFKVVVYAMEDEVITVCRLRSHEE